MRYPTRPKSIDFIPSQRGHSPQHQRGQQSFAQTGHFSKQSFSPAPSQHLSAWQHAKMLPENQKAMSNNGLFWQRGHGDEFSGGYNPRKRPFLEQRYKEIVTPCLGKKIIKMVGFIKFYQDDPPSYDENGYLIWPTILPAPNPKIPTPPFEINFPCKKIATISVPENSLYGKKLSSLGVSLNANFFAYFEPATHISLPSDKPYSAADLIAENNSIALQQAAIEKIVGPLGLSQRLPEPTASANEITDLEAAFHRNNSTLKRSKIYQFVEITYESLCGQIATKLISLHFKKYIYPYDPKYEELRDIYILDYFDNPKLADPSVILLPNKK
jgi:hypothetical protein